jgi:hypothetical protein
MSERGRKGDDQVEWGGRKVGEVRYCSHKIHIFTDLKIEINFNFKTH